MQSTSIAKLATALSRVQAQMKPVSRNAENPFFKSTYADLSACIKHAAPILAANGLAVIQTGKDSAEGTLSIVTTLAHESGEWIDGALTAKLAKNDPQGLGGAATYLRRYGYCAMIGLTQEGDDDDGNSHTAPPMPKPVAKPVPVATIPAPVKEFSAKACRDAWFNKLDLLTKTNNCTAVELRAFTISKGFITVKQSVSDWPESAIPKNKEQADKLVEEIKNYVQDLVP